MTLSLFRFLILIENVMQRNNPLTSAYYKTDLLLFKNSTSIYGKCDYFIKFNVIQH
jgi:hypothetical protein